MAKDDAQGEHADIPLSSQDVRGGRLTRRAAVIAMGASGLAAMATFGKNAPSPAGLRRHAARKGMSFGTMVPQRDLDPTGTAARIIAEECDTIVPGIALKWGETEKVEGRPNYMAAEANWAFAKARGLALRGHTAFWYRNVPAWAKPGLAGPDWRAMILRRTTDVVAHFKGRIFEWDVVNEAIEPRDALQGAMRRAPFGKQTDPGWIADCFHAAHTADPAARLIYNDYGLENVAPDDAARRAAVLALLENLVKRGAPVQGLGLQTHVGAGQRFDPGIYRTFLSDVAALGLKMRITEFDVSDLHAPTDMALRDAAVADRATRLLDVAFDEKAMLGLMCWGLSDADTSVGVGVGAGGSGRADGLAQRPTPYDTQWNRKPLWSAIARAFDGAPAR